MAAVTNIKGVAQVQAALKLRGAAYASKRVVVGYTANYAVYVHEDLEAYHPNGQAKYLEEPVRLLSAELGYIVHQALLRGHTLEEALLEAGLRLQAASQALVPVLTGNLRASAFTAVEDSPSTPALP